MTTINQIHVGPGGTFEASGDYTTKPSDIDALFAHLKANDEDVITIHFHGGLVNERKGVQIAEMMQGVYEEADNYALSFVWETGLIETFQQNLTQISSTELFQKFLKWVIKCAAERFGGFNTRGAGEPISMAEIEAELSKDRPFGSYDQAETGKGAARGGPIAVKEENLEDIQEELVTQFEELVDEDDEIEDLLREKGLVEPVDTSEKGIWTAAKVAVQLAKITYRVIRRHVRDRDHGFYPTVVEEILREYYLADLGAWVWGNMKDKAEDMWRPNDGLVGPEQHVGSYVLDAMATLQADRDVTFNLVGHSAGTIVICQLLKAVATRHPGIKMGSVIFLAAAARSDLALDGVVAHQHLFNSFQQFTMADSYECDDSLVPGIYTRSLLYFISGVLEPDMVDQPIAGMMRFTTGNDPFHEGAPKDWADFVLAAERTVLSDSFELDPGAPEGRRSASRKHGDFDNDEPTQKSLIHILQA